MIPIPTFLIVPAIAASVGFGSAWQIQSWRIAAKDKDHVEQRLEVSQESARFNSARQQSVIDAANARTARESVLRRDATNARVALNGLRDSTASALLVANTSLNTCTLTAATLGESVNVMAEAGAELAAKTGRHINDVETLTAAWPK